MTVYYRDASVEVTSNAIRVGEHRYRLDELARIWYRREQRSWQAVARRGGWGATLLAPLVTAAIALVIVVQLDVSGGTRAALVVAALLVGLGAALLMDPVLDRFDASFDRGVHVHEIWAERAGVELRLLRTDDASRFGRIYRALQRAAES